jgi:hypothetical protein
MGRGRPPGRSGPSGQAIRWEQVAKPGGGVRRLVRLDPLDALGYASAVRRVAPFVARASGSESHANRLSGWRATGPILEPWRAARHRWRGEVRRLGGAARAVATADVRRCYPSIAAAALRGRLLALGAREEDVEALDAWIGWFASVGVQGLPVGPDASAVLAEAVLQVGDEALRSMGVPHVRWVDDVAIFAADARRAELALAALVGSWASVGLEPNGSKTGALRDPAAWAAAITRTPSPAAGSALR